MARIPSVASLERREQYLKTRKERIEARQKAGPKVGSRGPAPKDDVKYHSIFANKAYVILASRKALQFFTGSGINLGQLGLAAPDIDDQRMPRGGKPSLVIATKGLAAPQSRTAISGRKYLKYTDNNDKATNNNFTAPISGTTSDALRTNFRNVYNAKRTEIGDYGRFYFKPEVIPIALSGQATGGNTGAAAT